MFKTIGNTWELIGASWRVLQTDRKLLLLPGVSGVAILLWIGLAIGVYSMSGTLGRLDNERSFTAIDYVLSAAFYLATTFTVIFFNAALVSAVHEKLNGRRGSVGDGLRAARNHLPEIFGWACFTTTVGLVIEQLRNGDGLVLKVVGWILTAIWGYMTYFVVPVLVIEGLSPIQAINRSTQLFQGTWGKQVVSNFGFGLAYLALFLVALIPLLLFVVSPVLGIAGLVLFSAPVLIGGIVVLVAMEGIFRTALYEFAVSGQTPEQFSDAMLRSAYVSKEDRGSWASWRGGSGTGGSSSGGGSAVLDSRERGQDIINRQGGF